MQEAGTIPGTEVGVRGPKAGAVPQMTGVGETKVLSSTCLVPRKQVRTWGSRRRKREAEAAGTWGLSENQERRETRVGVGLGREWGECLAWSQTLEEETDQQEARSLLLLHTSKDRVQSTGQPHQVHREIQRPGVALGLLGSSGSLGPWGRPLLGGWSLISVAGAPLSLFLWSLCPPVPAVHSLCHNGHQDQQHHAGQADADIVPQRVILGGGAWKKRTGGH